MLQTQFAQNIDRDTFFKLKFPIIIFKFALLKYSEYRLFNRCTALLNKVFSETPEHTRPLEEQIVRYLHKAQYNETLQFYLVVGYICTSSTASVTMLHSAIPTLLAKFYTIRISQTAKNTQLFESLDYETLRLAEKSDGSESEKSNASMASSLSLDEEIAYKRNDDGRPLSTRSLLSDFGNTLLDVEDKKDSDHFQTNEEEAVNDATDEP